jgi:hypothetical protein
MISPEKGWDGWMARQHVAQNFIGYNNLSREDRLFFAHSGLDRFIEIAGRVLSKRIGLIAIHNFDSPYFSDEGVRAFNILIGDLLMLIGRNSNKRYGFKIKNQDFYFQRVSERNGFPIHLYISRWQKKNTQLRKNKRYRETISKRKDVPVEVFSKKAFKGISAAHKVTFGRSRMNETETRAVGVLYMMNLVWKTIQEQRADSNFMRTFVKYASYQKVLEECEKLGIRNKNEKPFLRNSLITLLTNKKYIGQWEVNQQNKSERQDRLIAYDKYAAIELPHGCVIDLKLWDVVQQTIQRISGNKAMNT